MDKTKAYFTECLDIGPDEDDVSSVKVVESRSTKEWLFGTLDWGYMCMPKWPYCTDGAPRAGPVFFARKEWLGLVTAMVVGLQHALAMVGGLIVPPTLIVPFGVPNRTALIQYLVQAALIVCGIMTAVQVTSISFMGRKNMKFPMWGAGILSVMGVSFTSVPVATAVLPYLIAQGNTFEQAYGMYLGTICVTSLTPFIFVFLPMKVLKKIFPPVVSGVTIMLIGIHLTGAGMANWGGGSFCGQPTNVVVPVLCSGNGQVSLPFGSKPYVGLGFLVFITIILVEIFGSPFFRNCSAITGLLLGYIVAAGTNYGGSKYVSQSSFDNAPSITFLWTTKFPLGFYAPAIIPMAIVAIITSIETVGDTAATMEASRLPTIGPLYARRIQGALLNDAISGLFSALATSLPLTTFAQNNGVISLTNVASRQAGWWCAGFLFLLGCLGKFGAWVVSIPNCVLGGMTTFLFANIISSGIKIITTQGNMDRRTRFIMACSLALGVGVELYPQWANYVINGTGPAPNPNTRTSGLWPITSDMSPALLGVRQAIIICLTTSFTIGAITSFILNLIMPEEAVDPGQTAYEAETESLRAGEIMAPAPDASVTPAATKGAWAEADEAPRQPVMSV